MKKIIFCMAIITMIATSCTEDTPPVIPEDTFAFDGNWKGTYAGDDDGTIDVTIDDDGNLTGTGFSNNTSSSFSMTGTVDDDGKLTASATSIQSTFNGTLAGANGSGTWINTPSSISGSWTATLQ